METISAPRPSARVRAVDLAKCFAIFFVLLIHAGSDVLRYAPVGSIHWLSGLFWGSISRSAVPLFLLCSGALLLDRERPISARHIWRRNIPHMVMALFFWAAAYKAIGLLTSGNLTADALLGALRNWLLWQHEGHLYYLPIILLVYAALPLTRTFTAHADTKMVRYFLVFWAASGVLLPSLRALGLLQAFGGIVQQWALPMAWSAIGCTVLGDTLRRRPCSVRCAVWMFAGGFLLCFAGTWLCSARAGELKTPFLEGFSPGPCLMAAGMFSLCEALAPRLNARLNTAAERLSRASFCIYLVHIAVLRLLNGIGLRPGWHPLLTVPALAVLCGAGSYLLYLPLSRIPWVRRWLI